MDAKAIRSSSSQEVPDEAGPTLTLSLYSAIPRQSLDREVNSVRAEIDGTLCDSIGHLAADNTCVNHEVIYSATVCYLSQLIDEPELTLAVSTERARDEANRSATRPGSATLSSAILRVTNRVDAAASFTANLHHLTNLLRQAHASIPSSCVTETSDLCGTKGRQNGAVVLINFLAAAEAISDRDAFFISSAPAPGPRAISIDFRIGENQRPLLVLCRCDCLQGHYVKSLIDGFLEFFQAAVTAPQLPITSHALASGGDRDAIALQWNEARSTCPQLCVHELFERQVELTPHRTAIEHNRQTLTYWQLNHESNRVAHLITRIRPAASNKQTPVHRLVGICVDRSLEMIVAMLGVMKAGCAYVPIDPSYPEERMKFLASNAGIDLLLTQRHLIGRVAALVAHTICLEDVRSDPAAGAYGLASNNVPVRQVNLTPDDPVAVLYTSGSTGNPKGVFISHKGLASRLHWMKSTFPFTADEVAGHIAQLPFVRALWELLVPLTSGVKVVVIDLNTTKDPATLSESIGRHGITRLVTAPSLAQTLVSVPWQAGQGLRALKHWFIGGESLHYKTVKAIRETLPGISLCNLYGATEVHSFASYYPVVDDAHESTRVPVGRAIHSTSILVLDRHGRILPAGIHGEICVLGDGVSCGYLNQPDLTAAKFCSHGFTDLCNGPLYRTGDIGYWLHDGNIMFVSRLDHQVKIRGIRIELGEVESALLAHDGVEKAVVVASEHGPNDTRLVAYVVPRAGGNELSSPQWKRRCIYRYRRYLELKLPIYMIPAYFVILEKLPLNSYGKVLRRQLPAPEVDSVGSMGYCPPRNRLEGLLCRIWEDVLGVASIGVLDNFFDLGGHSLSASKISARVREALAVDLRVGEVLESPSVSALAQAIDKLAGRSSKLPLLTRAADFRPVPLTEQMRSWSPLLGKASSLVHFCLRIIGQVDVRALRESLAYLIERHDALRMTFAGTGDDTFILPSRTTHVDFDVVNIRDDLASADPSGRSANEILRNIVRGLLAIPSDTTSGRLTRWRLIQTRPLESILVGILDHLVVDGASISTLRRELKHVYEACRESRQPDLPPLALGYYDYARWQEQHRTTSSYIAERRSHKEHVQQVLAGVNPIKTRQAADSQIYYHKAHGIDRAIQTDVSSFCARLEITESMFHVATFHLAVYESLRQEQIRIFMFASGRQFQDLENAVGLFAHPVYLRSELAGGMTVDEYLARTRRSFLAAQSIAYTYLDSAELDLPGGAAVELMVNYGHFSGDDRWQLPGLEVEPISFVERMDSAAENPVHERYTRMLLRVEKNQVDEIAYVYGSGLVFTNAAFERFNDRLLHIRRGLSRATGLTGSIDDFLGSIG